MYLLILAGVIILSLVLIVLGLPGLWIMVATAVAYNLIVPGEPIGWVTESAGCVASSPSLPPRPRRAGAR